MANEQEKLAYQRGYAAGRKRAESDMERGAAKAEQRAFWERASLSVATYFMQCDGWTQGEKKLTGLDDRVGLIVDFADMLTAAWRKR